MNIHRYTLYMYKYIHICTYILSVLVLIKGVIYDIYSYCKYLCR